MRLFKAKRRAVVAAEYLMVALGVTAMAGATMKAVSDATVAESKKLAESIQGLNTSYSVPAQSTCVSNSGGSQYIQPKLQSVTAVP